MLIRITVPTAPKANEFGDKGAESTFDFKRVTALVLDALGIADKQLQVHLNSVWWQKKHNQRHVMSKAIQVSSSANGEYGETVYDIELNTVANKKLTWDNWIIGVQKDFSLYPERNGSVMNYSWTVETDVADLTHAKGEPALVVIWK